jgi:hypothetical protein
MFENKDNNVAHGEKLRLRTLALALPAMAGLTLAAAPAHALSLYNGSQYGNDLQIRLDINTSFSSFYRVNDPSAILAGPNNYNGNDGDQNLRHGFVGNVFEVLPVLDIKDGNIGAHFSGEYFLNTTYLGTTQNQLPSTINSILPKPNDFTSETRQANGNNGRLLDAFVYDKFTFGNDQIVTLKAGQQTLFWGQWHLRRTGADRRHCGERYRQRAKPADISSGRPDRCDLPAEPDFYAPGILSVSMGAL